MSGVVAAVLLLAAGLLQAQTERFDRGRFTAVFYPSEARLARSLVDQAIATDTFPGLPRPRAPVLLMLAPDKARFREWAGPDAPEWGAALAFPESRRIVMQGRDAPATAGDPLEVLRHELAHLALHEYLGDLPPRWFDEGYASYAAREWSRDDALAANLALALRGTPTLAQLDTQFTGGSTSAQTAYALAYRAVVDLAGDDPSRRLPALLNEWRRRRTLDAALRSALGVTYAGFEKDWQARMRRRYGALALAGDLAIAGTFLLLAVLPLYLARRQRDRRRMAELVAADVRAEEERVLAEILAEGAPETGETKTP